MAAVDVVLPVHNEGASIAGTLREFHAEVARDAGIPIRFVICEDGSSDDTVPVLQELAGELPIKLISDPVRKGYSRAVIDGLRATEAEWVLCIDSDGQCDPVDFVSLAAARAGYDMVIGYRNPRRDSVMRKLMSGAFGFVYRRFFNVRLRDPSCHYVLIRRLALRAILVGDVGILKQGFWWEFVARATALGLSIAELPVRHRVRSAGTTQVYRLKKIPNIALEHLSGLARLRRELRTLEPLHAAPASVAAAND
jgi:glycosyltransferase involved in cell wall biosynthesis